MNRSIASDGGVERPAAPKHCRMRQRRTSGQASQRSGRWSRPESRMPHSTAFARIDFSVSNSRLTVAGLIGFAAPVVWCPRHSPPAAPV